MIIIFLELFRRCFNFDIHSCIIIQEFLLLIPFNYNFNNSFEENISSTEVFIQFYYEMGKINSLT